MIRRILPSSLATHPFIVRPIFPYLCFFLLKKGTAKGILVVEAVMYEEYFGCQLMCHHCKISTITKSFSIFACHFFCLMQSYESCWNLQDMLVAISSQGFWGLESELVLLCSVTFFISPLAHNVTCEQKLCAKFQQFRYLKKIKHVQEQKKRINPVNVFYEQLNGKQDQHLN